VRTALRAAVIFFVIALGMQLVPITRDNPAARAPLGAPPEIASTLRRACFDCHSNETVWPWYSRVAPASWLIAHDVHDGREHLNFSTWTTLPAGEQRKVREAIASQVERGAMPPGIYTPLHPEAHLSLQDITTLAAWARANDTVR
jgi:hypothetical protein